MQEGYTVIQKFNEFNSKRNSFSLALSMIIMVLYYVFILCVGMFPNFLGLKLGQTSLTVGIVGGLGIIIISIITTGIYVYKANTQFDKEQEQILNQMQSFGIIQDNQLINEEVIKGEKA